MVKLSSLSPGGSYSPMGSNFIEEFQMHFYRPSVDGGANGDSDAVSAVSPSHLRHPPSLLPPPSASRIDVRDLSTHDAVENDGSGSTACRRRGDDAAQQQEDGLATRSQPSPNHSVTVPCCSSSPKGGSFTLKPGSVKREAAEASFKALPQAARHIRIQRGNCVSFVTALLQALDTLNRSCEEGRLVRSTQF